MKKLGYCYVTYFHIYFSIYVTNIKYFFYIYCLYVFTSNQLLQGSQKPRLRATQIRLMFKLSFLCYDFHDDREISQETRFYNYYDVKLLIQIDNYRVVKLPTVLLLCKLTCWRGIRLSYAICSRDTFQTISSPDASFLFNNLL